MTKNEFMQEYVISRIPTTADQKYLTRDIVSEAEDFWNWIEAVAPRCAVKGDRGVTCTPYACDKENCPCDSS